MKTKLSIEALRLMEDIRLEGDLAPYQNFCGCNGWQELIEANLLNQWEDDSGNKYVEIGPQQ